MFRFNFFDECKTCYEDNKTENPEAEKCEEVFINNAQSLSESKNTYSITLSKSEKTVEIKHTIPDDVINSLKNENNSLIEVENQHSDLVSGVYEGGLKIWECTFDLVNFLFEENINFQEKKVLDLGCGAGIVGIFALLSGAKTVFQDYNVEVLKHATIPNVLLNTDFKNALGHSKFFSGDWNSFINYLLPSFTSGTDEKFDFILTSETIYNCSYYDKLHSAFKELLSKNGDIYVAAKSYYFGLGGGVHDFIEFVNCQNIFSTRRCWESQSGVIREIIHLKFK